MFWRGLRDIALLLATLFDFLPITSLLWLAVSVSQRIK